MLCTWTNSVQGIEMWPVLQSRTHTRRRTGMTEGGRRKGKEMKKGIKMCYVHLPTSHRECRHYTHVSMCANKLIFFLKSPSERLSLTNPSQNAPFSSHGGFIILATFRCRSGYLFP